MTKKLDSKKLEKLETKRRKLEKKLRKIDERLSRERERVEAPAKSAPADVIKRAVRKGPTSKKKPATTPKSSGKPTKLPKAVPQE